MFKQADTLVNSEIVTRSVDKNKLINIHKLTERAYWKCISYVPKYIGLRYVQPTNWDSYLILFNPIKKKFLLFNIQYVHKTEYVIGQGGDRQDIKRRFFTFSKAAICCAISYISYPL